MTPSRERARGRPVVIKEEEVGRIKSSREQQGSANQASCKTVLRVRHTRNGLTSEADGDVSFLGIAVQNSTSFPQNDRSKKDGERRRERTERMGMRDTLLALSLTCDSVLTVKAWGEGWLLVCCIAKCLRLPLPVTVSQQTNCNRKTKIGSKKLFRKKN